MCIIVKITADCVIFQFLTCHFYHGKAHDGYNLWDAHNKFIMHTHI